MCLECFSAGGYASLTSEPVILMSCQSKLHVVIHVHALEVHLSKPLQHGMMQTETSFKNAPKYPSLFLFFTFNKISQYLHSSSIHTADAVAVHVGGGSRGRPPDFPLHMLVPYKTISILIVLCFLSFVPLCFLFSCMGVCLQGCIITIISSGLRSISFKRISEFLFNRF